MKIHDLHDADGRAFAFEVSNLFLSRRRVCGVVRRIPGARITKEPPALSFSDDDEFCEFELDGVAFVASEDWGDSSRYWIGPQPPRLIPQTARVREAFAQLETIPKSWWWIASTVIVFAIILLLLR